MLVHKKPQKTNISNLNHSIRSVREKYMSATGFYKILN